MWHSVFMHQSFVSTYGDSSGIAGLRCRAISRFCCPHSAGVITLGHLPRWEFLLCRAGQRAGLLLAACPHSARLMPDSHKLVYYHWIRGCINHACAKIARV